MIITMFCLDRSCQDSCLCETDTETKPRSEACLGSQGVLSHCNAWASLWQLSSQETVSIRVRLESKSGRLGLEWWGTSALRICCGTIRSDSTVPHIGKDDAKIGDLEDSSSKLAADSGTDACSRCCHFSSRSAEALLLLPLQRLQTAVM